MDDHKPQGTTFSFPVSGSVGGAYPPSHRHGRVAWQSALTPWPRGERLGGGI